MALTRGEAGLFLHVCQMLFLLLPTSPSFLDLCYRVALHDFSPAIFHSILLFYPSSPLSLVSGVGPSLCAKVPPVYRAPDFPPALQLDCCGLIFFFLITFFNEIFFIAFFFSGRLLNRFFSTVSPTSTITPSFFLKIFFSKCP